MSSKPVLRLDWCSHEAAKYAVEKWHYSRSLPAGKAARLGVWENEAFIGVVLFSRGASDAIGKPYDLKQTEVAELARVALAAHVSPASRILAVAIRLLVSQSPGLRLIVSYADPAQLHYGGIYQATNWIYTGETSKDFAIVDRNGKRWHSRMVSSTGYKTCFGERKKVIKPSEGRKVIIPGKHKYLRPLDDEMRAKIAPLAKPYPKRAGSVAGDTLANHAGKGGSTPTPALSDTEVRQ